MTKSVNKLREEYEIMKKNIDILNKRSLNQMAVIDNIVRWIKKKFGEIPEGLIFNDPQEKKKDEVPKRRDPKQEQILQNLMKPKE